MQNHEIDPDAWDLVRERKLLEPMFKVGDSVGLIGFMDCETEEGALSLLEDLLMVTEGIIDLTAEKVSRVAHFD